MLRRLLLLIQSFLSPTALLLTTGLLLLSVSVFSRPQIVRAAIWTVNTLDDDDDTACDDIAFGDCTLREAINASQNNDIIQFNIAGTGIQQITLGSALPEIAFEVIIDGSTQADSTCDSPTISVSGNGVVAGPGFEVTGGNTTIRGLEISSFGGSGIRIQSDNNTIECNLIVDNFGDGVEITSGVGNLITQTAIRDNFDQGIDLNGNGRTPNDPGDADLGANEGVNFPTLLTAVSDGSQTTVTGEIQNGLPNTTFVIEFYSNVSCADTQGEQFAAASGAVTTDGTGDATFTEILPGYPVNSGITATATDSANNTSEFSDCVLITGVPVYESDPVPASALPTIITTPGVVGDAIINVRNAGNGPLTGAISLQNESDPGVFNITPANYTIAPVDPPPSTDRVVGVTCLSATPGIYTVDVEITHNDPNQASPAVYAVTCEIAPPDPIYESTPAEGGTIDLGGTLVGASVPVLDALVIRNGVGATANLNATITIGDPRFTANPVNVTNLGAGGEREIVITCTPDVEGPITTQLTVTTNDADEPVGGYLYDLECTGQPPTITVAPATVPNGSVGALYPQQTFTASGSGGTIYTFAVDDIANLPPGLTFNPATRILSGTPTTDGTYTFAIRATDAFNYVGETIYTVVINPAGVLTLNPPDPLPNGTGSNDYTQTFVASGGTPPYTYTVDNVANLPPGLTFVNGLLSGRPTAAGTYAFTVNVTDGVANGSQLYNLTIDPPAIDITPASPLPGGTGSTPYTVTFGATGSQEAFTFTIPAGEIPPGLTFNGATGILSGTPTAAGTFDMNVTATDANGFTATELFQLTIAAPVITITTANPLPSGTEGVLYTDITFTATGGTGPYTFTVTGGALPDGMTLSPAGVFGSTPTTAGNYTFTVTPTDANGFPGTAAVFNITITPVNIVITTANPLPNGTVGFAYNDIAFAATGGTGPYTFAVTGGAVPPAMNLAPNGVFGGTPTADGLYTFTVTPTDANGIVGTPATFNVTIVRPAIQIDPVPPLPNGSVGTPYPTITFTATGASPGAITWAITGDPLPAGLTFVNGVLSGTPTAAGTATFVITATDQYGSTGDETYTLTVDTPVITVAPPNLNPGTINTDYGIVTFTATGGVAPYTMTHTGAAPPGMTLNDAAQTLSGTPTATGTYNFRVIFTDVNGITGFRDYVLVINPAAGLTIGPANLPDGTVGTVYLTQTLSAAGGTAPYTWAVSAGTLPPGLTLNPTTGVLSGTPTTANTYTFTVRATDSTTPTALTGERQYTVTIGTGPTATPGTPIYSSSPAVSSSINIVTVTVGTAISTTLTIFNTGTGVLIVNRPGTGFFAGANPTEFSVSAGIPTSVNPGGGFSSSVTITCVPAGVGLRTSTLSFLSNDPARRTVSYSISCTGSATAISVTSTPPGFVATATAFVPTATPVVPANGQVVEVDGLAMRTGPYLAATLIGVARPGQPYDIPGYSDDEGGGIRWYLIRNSEGVVGWVSGRFLQVSGNLPAVPAQGSVFDGLDGAPDLGVLARTMAIIDIRRRPSGRAAIIGQLPKDAEVSVLGRTRQNGGDFWVQIRYNGIVGWIPAAPIDVYTNTGAVPIR